MSKTPFKVCACADKPATEADKPIPEADKPTTDIKKSTTSNDKSSTDDDDMPTPGKVLIVLMIACMVGVVIYDGFIKKQQPCQVNPKSPSFSLMGALNTLVKTQPHFDGSRHCNQACRDLCRNYDL